MLLLRIRPSTPPLLSYSVYAPRVPDVPVFLPDLPGLGIVPVIFHDGLEKWLLHTASSFAADFFLDMLFDAFLPTPTRGVSLTVQQSEGIHDIHLKNGPEQTTYIQD